MIAGVKVRKLRLIPDERGFLLETWILHELRAAMSLQSTGGELSYWRTPSGSEVDFVWTRGDRSVAIEVKAGEKWQRNQGRALNELVSAGRVLRCFGVYRGTQTLKLGDVLVLPCIEFLAKLHAGEVLG